MKRTFSTMDNNTNKTCSKKIKKCTEIEKRFMDIYKIVNIKFTNLYKESKGKLGKKRRSPTKSGVYNMTRNNIIMDMKRKEKDIPFFVYNYKHRDSIENEEPHLKLLDFRTIDNNDAKDFEDYKKEVSQLFRRANLLLHRKLTDYTVDKLSNVMRSHFSLLDGFIFTEVDNTIRRHKIAVFYPNEKLKFKSGRKYTD